MTGRAAGYCAGYGVPGFANPQVGGGFGRRGGFGRGMGRGFGFGWGRGFGYGVPYGPQAAPQLTQEQELEQLKDQAQYLKGALDEIGKRIQDLDSSSE